MTQTESKMNFCASWLGFGGFKLLDEMGNTINTIFYNNEIYPFRYTEPFIEYDILDERRVLKEPIIKTICESKQIESMGFVVCSVPVPKGGGWKYKQKVRHILAKIDSWESKNYDQIVLSRRTGCTHKVQFDEANNRIRLIGPLAGYMGESKWYYIGDTQ